MKGHSWESAVGPANRAGPIDRAGLTDVPVSGMPTRWMTVRTRPMARPATPGVASTRVTSSTTTSNAVSTISTTSAPNRLTDFPQEFEPSAPVWSVTPPATTISFNSPAATMAPTTWATT